MPRRLAGIGCDFLMRKPGRHPPSVQQPIFRVVLRRRGDPVATALPASGLAEAGQIASLQMCCSPTSVQPIQAWPSRDELWGRASNLTRRACFRRRRASRLGFRGALASGRPATATTAIATCRAFFSRLVTRALAPRPTLAGRTGPARAPLGGLSVITMAPEISRSPRQLDPSGAASHHISASADVGGDGAVID
jgi:hypothetical protein